jgi:hypothetical protein
MPILSTGKAEHNAKLRHIISNKKVQKKAPFGFWCPSSSPEL